MVPCCAEVYEKIHQSDDHNITDENSMNIGILSHGGGINSVTHNKSRKTRRIIVDPVEKTALETIAYNDEVLKIDCWCHLRNMWLGGMTKELSE